MSGCYGEFRPGISSPLSSHHGSTGVDIDTGLGVEVQTPYIRAGGGVWMGARVADTNGFPLGVEGRVIVPISSSFSRRAARVLFILHEAIAFAHPFDEIDNAHTGVLYDTFVGLGVGHTAPDHRLGKLPGHLAVGVTAARASDDVGDHYWTVGVAVEASFGIEGTR